MGDNGGGPFQTVFRASLLVLGTVLALNMAVAYLQPIVPWLIGAVVIAGIVWGVVAVTRWRRSQW
ncbi:hypothetical protein OHR68_14040 [Spirillospora sp. NBC_00431]